jgi:zinc transport system permease protein
MRWLPILVINRSISSVTAMIITSNLRLTTVDLTDLLAYGFMQRAFITGCLIACACSVLGIFLLLHRLSLIGDGLAHVTFGSVAISLFLNMHTLLISIPIVLLSSIGIFKLTQRSKLFGDASIGIVSSLGVAGGVLIASVSGGFNVDLFSYLFGNILSVSKNELIISAVLCFVVLAVIALLFQELLAVTFDEETARTSGINTNTINIMLVLLTAMTVVLAMKVVGVMLISSLLILPAATALQLTTGFRTAITISAISGIASVCVGITGSFLLNIPSGATIVLINLLFFASAAIFRRLRT